MLELILKKKAEMNFKLSTVLFLLVFVIASCGTEKGKKASSDLVKNPISAENPDANPDENAPYLSFTDKIHDFGKLKDGDITTYRFKFKNTGKTDLIIANASASCGCTIPSYPREPIPPGGENFIDVQFNSKGKIGVFEKTISITANTIPVENLLVIKGEVLPITK